MVRKYTNRRRYKRKPKTFLQKALPVAQKALKVAKFVAGALNVEYRYNIASASLVSTSWNGSVNSLILPSQGDTAIARQGDSIKLKNIVFRGVVDYNTLGVAETVRVIIFIDKQNSISTASQYLQTTGVYLATESVKNEDNKFRTKCLFDRHYMVSADRPQARIKWDAKLNFHQHYQAGTTTVTTNALKILIISQNPTNTARMSYISRVSFVDN